ncbi:flagellar export chaperone FliS [Colwellia sp. 4_MG-2023]|jgi:flagellar protein FliS|uniref:flagellar export chaperone FliS n=1 Tax=unclassified Colwellia TaxID=196834 RepID=UPI001C08AC8A|nr:MULTISPECIES: flagellar export chaperone FliS [unclassified Colwellia]MBU2925305.1 flagellar export chaperone FliS [Colwellia sp. C2M11]MDO6486777.1 flagellar export chaperone FliS [Colwellia sp. 6_MG-2023]MDO6506963.1 flagellar export chaperone FliS [Colwellia sp. 5_MG-2023]MDO6556599.1 flagellar export chaperone FliS [Colwellia sp. 4_MG-2023]MDO6651170.1 flagellar export chaperone FliS [Colwellia sp. 3_MG-2023]
MAHVSLKKYQQTTVSNAGEATPYQLVAMLFQKLLDNIATAKGAIAQKDYAKKGAQISNAIAILGVLEGSLDHSQGGDISENLSALYTFSSEKLFEASTNNDIELLNEIALIIIPIKSGWDSIPPEEQGKVSF